MRVLVVFAFALGLIAGAFGCGGQLFGSDDESSQMTDSGAQSDASDASETMRRDAGISVGVCPTGLAGAILVPATTTSGAAYCIDSTEVTNGSYKAFLDTKPSPITQARACSQNASFTPPFNWPTSAEDDNRPVINVDWCDAKAY
ncbi:MAG: SUMF1/EgtB/PvdO family nonheme iron enzyme, partial [Polyangiaceae bacterium]